MINSTASFALKVGSDSGDQALRDQVGGALSCAAVLRGGLGLPTPHLCRYAKHATDLILARFRAFNRPVVTLFVAHVR